MRRVEHTCIKGNLFHSCALFLINNREKLTTKNKTSNIQINKEKCKNKAQFTCGTFSGYGTLSSGGSLAKMLMQVDVPIVSQSSCKKAYGSSIHESMVCAGLDRGGKDSCQGDSGGPMVCEDGGKFYLEGVVSWGSGCASPGKYGVYARVRYLRQWVDSTMSTY